MLASCDRSSIRRNRPERWFPQAAAGPGEPRRATANNRPAGQRRTARWWSDGETHAAAAAGGRHSRRHGADRRVPGVSRRASIAAARGGA